MDEKTGRLRSWMLGKKNMPYTLEINPTNRCNLKCLYCWQQNFDDIDKEDKISKQRLLEIVREAGKLGIKEIRIPGSGEPFMRKDTIEVMHEIKNNKINGLIITNGTLLDEEKIKEIIDMKWDCVTFSFDSADKRINDYFRGKGSFDILHKNLLLFKKLKKIKKSRYPLIRFNIVITNKNYNSILAIIKYAKTVSCRDVEFQPLTVWSKNSEKLKLEKNQILELNKTIPKIKALAEKYGIFTNINSFLGNDIVDKASGNMEKLMFRKNEKIKFLELPCYEPWYNMIVLPEGKVNPCSMAGSVFGDNIMEKSLKDLWFGKYFSDTRKALIDKKLPSFCKKCCAVVFVENNRIREKLRNG